MSKYIEYNLHVCSKLHPTNNRVYTYYLTGSYIFFILLTNRSRRASAK
ncbi:unnamed protein product [Callosobruchus maculatus]|uniref:Uncharacterized protein n=1 Tax=Callosobruchus maculatus TaxID=64391 RepID=A0A653D520_CALMS|nr:unnamed protein product [Callosobruchus maculatus]